MKVAVVFPEVEADVGGGFTFAETLLAALREAHERSRHQFVAYVPPGTSAAPLASREISRGRRQRWPKGGLRLLRAVQDYVGAPRWGMRTWFERAIEEDGIELVWFATYRAEDCDIPFVFTMFDLAYLEHPWFPEVSRRGEWERRHHYFSRFLPKATAVIVPNEAGAEQLKRYFDVADERTLVLAHPTPAFALRAAEQVPSPAVLERHGILQPYLFYPAQFWAHKNHFMLLETLVQLRRRGRDYHAVCVGSDQGQLQHVQRLVLELDLQDRVRILGFVDSDELVSLYKQAHALLYLSYFGPENLPPLEAFALGCPVVASDISGAREQLGDASLLVAPTDSEAIASAVMRLEDESLRANLVARARARAEERSGVGYVRGMVEFLDRFESIRRCWG